MDYPPLWYKDAVFYQMNVRAFYDSNGDGHGDFLGVVEKADYLAELGVNAVWMMPFYPSPLKDDGYDVSDYYNVAEKYGTLDDFKKALAALHERGIRVVIDLVINHTSSEHPWFVEARSSKDNPKRDWYVWSDTDRKYTETRIIFLDVEKSNWTLDPQTGQYFWHRFYSHQPDLNFDNPEVQEEMLNAMRFWLDLGVDGFRVDAVPYLYEREGTNCENLPETHDYIKKMRRVLDQEYPGRIMLAEANQWPQDLLPYLEDEFHMAFHFPIMPRLYMGLKRGNNADIIKILNETPAIPPDTQWCVFLRNHDELTLEMVTLEDRYWMWEQYAPNPRMKQNLGIRRRLAPLLDNQLHKIEFLNALLFALPGTPIIYNGDEIGMGDNVWLEDRNGLRTPMQWNNSKNGGFSMASRDMLYSSLICDEEYGYGQVNVDAARENERSIFHRIKHQIIVRKQHPIFGRGKFEVIPSDNEAVFVFERSDETVTTGSKRVLVLANLSAQLQNVAISAERFQGLRPVDLLTNTPYTPIQGETYTLAMRPHNCIWLALYTS
jgi:maltose alpha-D-glucosyltransferase/alpha-amylase